MNRQRTLRYLAGVFILATLYHLGARLGLQMAYVQQNTSPVWPPSGIGLAALLLLGIRFWPGIMLGVVGGSLLTGASPALSLGLGLANTLEAIIATLVLEKWVRLDLSIQHIQDVIGLVAASVVATAVSAAIGVTTLVVVRGIPTAAFAGLWIVWLIGNLLGCLVITPLLLTWRRVLVTSSASGWPRLRYVEAGAFLVLLALVALYIFQNPSGTEALHQALIYVIFPFAIWAAFRFGQVGAATTTFTVSSIAIWGTIHELGPFARMPLNESLILLQTFTGVVALISLMLAAASAERRHAEGVLRRQVEELAALNEASKQFLENVDQRALYRAICRSAVESFDLAASWLDVSTPDDPSHVPEGAYPEDLLVGGRLLALLAASPDIEEGQRIVRRTHQPAPLAEGVTIPLARDTIRSLTALPLACGKELVGILTVGSRDPAGFAEDQLLLLGSYANLAAAAIQNAWLFGEVCLGNEQLRALSQRLIEVQEAERAHLSRELHDASSQALAGLMVNLGLLERDADSSGLVRSHTADLRRIATEVLDNLHATAVKLRPDLLDHLGLVTALEQHIRDFNRQYCLDVQFETVGLDGCRMPGDVETALFRIAQEALTNVALHAHPTHVDVLLNRRNGTVVLTVEDDGVGFNADRPVRVDRIGIIGMRERVEMLGGKLLVESAPGKGTMISVEVPYGDARFDSR